MGGARLWAELLFGRRQARGRVLCGGIALARGEVAAAALSGRAAAAAAALFRAAAAAALALAAAAAFAPSAALSRAAAAPTLALAAAAGALLYSVGVLQLLQILVLQVLHHNV